MIASATSNSVLFLDTSQDRQFGHVKMRKGTLILKIEFTYPSSEGRNVSVANFELWLRFVNDARVLPD
jgi:hypothetical protein